MHELSEHRYHLSAYETWLRSRSAAARTLRCRLILARRIALLWPHPEAVTSDDVAAFLSAPEFSHWTRVTYSGHLRSLFGWLARAGHLEHDPTHDLDMPSRPRSRPRPLTDIDAKRAQGAATGDTYAILMLGMLAGLRAHEAAKIHSRDITDLGIFVRGKGGHEALVPVHPILVDIAVERGEGYWFPGQAGRDHIGPNSVTMRVTRLFSSLGIDGSFHRCRHYYGTSLLRAGVNIRVVQELMRHSSLATTAAYLGVDEDEKTAAIRALAA